MTCGITLPTASVVIAKVKNIRQVSQRISCALYSHRALESGHRILGRGFRRLVATVCTGVYRWRVQAR